jgi:hypothetical protein
MKTMRAGKLPSPLAGMIEAQFACCAKAQDLFFSFLSGNKRNADGAKMAINAARDRQLPWELRCVAILMLEHHALPLWSQKKLTLASQSLLESLGLMSRGVIRSTVLDEGFSTTEPAPFIAELRNRMARFEYIHANIRGLETKPEELLDFIRVSRRPCNLSLARYLFDTDEVADRILEEVRSSEGLPRPPRSTDYRGEDLEEPAPPRLCEFDRKLASQLRDHHRVLWVAEQTSSELNSLVEYPLGTVALVIKPPGSDLEFEVKRAGIRGPHLLNVVYERNGKPVPLPHRLQGASYGYMMEYEHLASGRFSEIYQRIHKAEAPMSRSLGITAISTVPNGSGDAHLIEYLSNADAFGPGFATMRAEMQRCVDAFEGTERRDELIGPIGLTTRFLLNTVPNQAWMAGTTSFRLDRTSDLLSSRGPELYFEEGLRRKFTSDDARRLADEILREVLGVYQPPACRTIVYRDYIQQALALPCNRAIADRTYLECAADIGRYWGTLLGVGGYTEGESFVTRNVGLKSRWANGQWRTRICFMDHDCIAGLGIPGEQAHAAWSIEGMRKDSDWICEDPKENSEFACLRRIYDVSGSMETQGEELFRMQVCNAYRKTRMAMRDQEPVRKLFDSAYVDGLIVRDELIRSYLCRRGSDAGIEAWKALVKEKMASTVYAEESLPYLFDTVARNAHRLERYANLYEPLREFR